MDEKSKLNSGRSKQKHRTREALIDAATQLMRQGRVPSIEEVADEAQVSRATAYRYFPTQEHVLAGAAVLSTHLDGQQKLEDIMAASNDPATRLDGVVQAFHERFSGNEVAYRTLLRLMLQPGHLAPDSAEQPRVRASRQVFWIREALSPLRETLGGDRFEYLVSALIGATGLESYTALRDVSLLDAAQAGAVMRWSARALLKAAQVEAEDSIGT